VRLCVTLLLQLNALRVGCSLGRGLRTRRSIEWLLSSCAAFLLRRGSRTARSLAASYAIDLFPTA
jgi:hypothetical protein